MAPGYGSGYRQEVRVTLDGRGELPAEMWGENGVPWSDVADARSGSRTTIYRDDGRKLVIEPRHGRLTTRVRGASDDR